MKREKKKEAAERSKFVLGATGQQDRLLALWRKAVRCLAGVHPQDDVLLLIRNLKLTLLSHRWSLQLFTTIRRCHRQSAPALLLEKLSLHEHQHGTRGRQQGDFRPFQPASLAGPWSYLFHQQSTSPVEHASQGGANLQFHVKFYHSLTLLYRQEPFADLFWKHYHLITFFFSFSSFSPLSRRTSLIK